MLLKRIQGGFTPTFWIANTLELFERLAFYGSKAVLAVFLLDKVGLIEEAATFTGIFSGVIYFLPVVAGVFVDKYGFRKALMACFFIFCIGYFLIGMAGMEFGEEIVNAIGKKAYTLSVLLFTAVGGSLIKPCIVGTVAKTSKPEVKSLGFSIYYTLVNFGGTIGPLLALPIRENIGIEFVLMMSSFTSFLLFIGTWFFFKEPRAEGEEEKTEVRTFGKVFGDMMLVFTNLRFMAFLIIFGGFWLMFWQIFYLMPFYAREVIAFNEFEYLEAVDAACIIFLTVPMAALVRSWKPFSAMTLGFVIASLSWIVIGVFQSPMAAIIGIAIYAIGEATQAPRFYEYVSNLAPKDQIGTFMGFAFLPVSIGSFAAGPVADWLRNNYMATNPAMMWYIVSGIGLTATFLMILYNMFLVPKTSQE
jgi:dipeptide/tripeptide permease